MAKVFLAVPYTVSSIRTTRERESGSMVKKRLDWLDIAKGIAILLVIVGHTVNNPSPIRQVIFSFHMPLFFILAGYTFRMKPWGELVKTSCTRLLVPYFLVTLSWKIPYFFTTGGQVDGPSLLAGLGTILFASGTDVPVFGFDAAGMSWFLMALFVSRLLLNALMMLFERFRVPELAQGLVCLAIAFAGVSCSKFFGIYLPLSGDVSFYVVLLMWCGHMARKHGVSPESARWYVVLAAFAVWVACIQIGPFEISSRNFAHPVSGTIGALAGTFFVCWVSTLVEQLKNVSALGWLERFLSFCGRNSLAIFCIHALDWMFPWQSMPYLKTLPFAGGIASALRCACDVSIAYVVKKA